MDNEEDELDPRRAYQAYKNFHRNIARSSSRSSFDTWDSVSVGNESRTAPLGNVSYASQNKPSTSGPNKPSTSASKPEEYEVVVISDDDDEEPFLDLTSTPDNEPEPKRPALPLVCDLTEDGNYDIFINEKSASPASTAMPAPIGTQKKVQEWLEAGQGEPVKSGEYVTKIVPRHVTRGEGFAKPVNSTQSASVFSGTGNRPAVMMTQDIRRIIGSSTSIATTTIRSTPMMTKDVKKFIDVPVATVLPIAQQKMDSSAQLLAATQTSMGHANVSSASRMQSQPQQPSNTNAHPKCTCHLRHTAPAYSPNVSGDLQPNVRQHQINPSSKLAPPPPQMCSSTLAQNPATGDSNSQQVQKPPIDDTVIILD